MSVVIGDMQTTNPFVGISYFAIISEIPQSEGVEKLHAKINCNITLHHFGKNPDIIKQFKF